MRMSVLVPDLIWSQNSLLPGFALWIAGERILRVAPVSELGPDDHPVYLRGKVLLPGLVNAHSHAFQRGLRGHVQWSQGQDSFWAWRDRMYALANRLDPDGVEAISALCFLEMVRAGFTTVGEFHYLQHQPDGSPYADRDELALRVAAAAEKAGIRLVLLRVAYGRAGHGLPPNPLQRRFYDRAPDDVLAAAQRLRSRGLSVGIAPHSVRACTLDWLRELAIFEGPVHAHVDEQPAEIQASQKEYGLPPLEVYGQAGLLSPNFTAVHFTHPSEGEGRLLRERGARVCVCPTTELDLGDGLFPAENLGDVPLCIGTDSHAMIDPFTELRSLEWNTRARTGRRNVLVPHDQPDSLAAALWKIGSEGGADSLHLPTGRLEAGMYADLVALDLERLELVGARPLPGIVFSGNPSFVRDVWVGGRQVLQEGRHLAEASIRAASLRVMADF